MAPDAVEGVTHRFIATNGISMHIAEAGTGPLVLLLHGFPEFWFAWRHQIPALVRDGYRVVAPDMRGFGETDAPTGADKYTALHFVGDFVGLLDALGEKQGVGLSFVNQAYVVGHDWGANLAWYLALLRPDLVKALVALSVPFRTRDPRGSSLVGLKRVFGDGHYMLKFQKPGEAEADFARYDNVTVFKKILLKSSGEPWVTPKDTTVPEFLQAPETLPAWITEEELEYYARQYDRTGWTGPLNVYRAENKTWELLSPWTGKGVDVPALYIAGDRDMVFVTSQKHVATRLKQQVPNLERTVVLPSGHFMQLERPEEVNGLVLAFLGKHRRLTTPSKL